MSEELGIGAVVEAALRLVYGNCRAGDAKPAAASAEPTFLTGCWRVAAKDRALATPVGDKPRVAGATANAVLLDVTALSKAAVVLMVRCGRRCGKVR